MATFISDEEMARLESSGVAKNVDTNTETKKASSAKKFLSDEEMVEHELKNVEKDEILGVPKTTIEGVLDALPFAGTLAGGVIGGAGTLGTGTVVGAGLGAGLGKSLSNTLKSALGIESAPKTRGELYGGVAKEVLLGAAGEAGGQLVSPAAKSIGKVARSTKDTIKKAFGADVSGAAAEKLPVIIDPDLQRSFVIRDPNVNPEFLSDYRNPALKGNAKEIVSSTKSVSGREPTPGMVLASESAQNVENVIAQSPTVAGESLRETYQGIQKGLRETGEGLVESSPITQYEAGTDFRTGLTSKIRQRVHSLGSKFEEIREHSKHIEIDKASSKRTAQRLRNQDLAEFADLPQGQAINKYADMIENAKSLDSLKQLRSSVDDELGRAIDAGDGQLALALGRVKKSIQRLERREVLKSAIANSPTKFQGEKAAKALIDDIKSVNRGWREMMSELEEIAKAGGIKKIGSPNHLIRIIDNMPSEQLSKRFFDTKNFDGLRAIKTHLPEEFDLLREAKLAEIAERSKVRGEIDPLRLFKEIKKIGKESRELIFGPRAEQVLRDMETVLNSFPRKVGASDTPRGVSWFGRVLGTAFNPQNWGNEASAAWHYLKLQGQVSKNLKPQSSNFGKSLKEIGPRAASYGVVAEYSDDNRPKRGPERWAFDGYEKLSRSYGVSLSEEQRKDPRVRRLLIEASNLPGGSRGLKKIADQLKSEVEP